MSLLSESERRIRVFCDDPEATDSSSDEEYSSGRRRRKTKTMVVEICIPPTPLATASTPNASCSSSPFVRRKAFPKKVSPLAPPVKETKMRGVRQRKWGKWAAEIRDPIRRIRLWLGTYDTPEEAAVAYQREAMRLEAEKNAIAVAMDISSSSAASSTSENYDSHPPISVTSPSSVLDLSNAGVPAPYKERKPHPVAQDRSLHPPECKVEDVVLPFDFAFDVGSFLPDDELAPTSNTFGGVFEELPSFVDATGVVGKGPFDDCCLEDALDFDVDQIAWVDEPLLASSFADY